MIRFLVVAVPFFSYHVESKYCKKDLAKGERCEDGTSTIQHFFQCFCRDGRFDDHRARDASAYTGIRVK